MGTPSNQLPESFLRYVQMRYVQKEPLTIPPVPEIDTKAERDTERRTERRIHHLFESWLRLNEIPYVHSRMDRKPTIRAGWPDFSCLWNSTTCFIEFKLPGKELSDDQETVRLELVRAGFDYLVAFTPETAMRWTKKELGMV